MGLYGTFIVARDKALLPHLPEVQQAFGTRALHLCRGRDDWQLLLLRPPYGHHWPTVGAGPAPLAEVTGAPALAVWVSESSCLQYAAATPGGGSWTAHFADEANHIPNPDRAPHASRCAYDHHRWCTLRLPEGVDVPPDDQAALSDNLAAWAAAGGLATTPRRILEALGAKTNEEAIYALVDALDLEPLEFVEPSVDPDDPKWFDARRIGEHESARLAGEWVLRLKGRANSADWAQPLPGAAEFVRFLDLVEAAQYGGGLTRKQLAAEAQRLLGTHPEP
ncbi:hypothetical protein [Dactylosporangium salmoneum]|uniref:Uncharacterized protein n=1 Tax=Dactylosporangium salmoneum TaxID=53361 RepID=A0ABP5SYI6_9ACTN